MNIERKIIILGFLVIAGLCLTLGLLIKYQTDSRKSDIFFRQIHILPEQIRYYDEVLTMSARMAAFTYKTHWIKRYNDTVEPLDNVIEKVKVLFPDVIKDLTTIDIANQTLIKFEIEAIELVKQQKIDKAQQVLFSNEYMKNKKHYADGLQRVLNKIKINIQKGEKNAAKRFSILVAVIVSVFIMTVIFGGLLFLLYRRQNKELEKLTGHLEEIVIDRTNLLTKTNDLFEEAQKVTHLGNWEWSIPDNKLVWSNEIYRIFGLKPQEFGATYDAFINTVHTGDRKLVRNAVNAALETGDDYTVRYRIILPNGSIKIVFERGKVELDDDHKPIRMIGTVQDITKTIIKERELEAQEKLASTDQLTGIYNRHKFEKLISNEIVRFNRYKRPLSLIMFDIDHFKKVNDNYGHDEGDRVLQHIVEIVKSHTRRVDFFVRWGGEEFFILCPETDLQDSITLAEKFRTNIEAATFGAAGKVTASFGVVTFKDKENEETFLKRVDNALYLAKSEGRNRVKFL